MYCPIRPHKNIKRPRVHLFHPNLALLISTVTKKMWLNPLAKSAWFALIGAVLKKKKFPAIDPRPRRDGKTIQTGELNVADRGIISKHRKIRLERVVEEQK